MPTRQIELIRRFRETSVAVVGDLILDEYVEGPARRISPEAPVQVVTVDRTFFRLGGAANVAHLTATLGAKTSVTGAIGADPAGRSLRDLLDAASIDRASVLELASRPTTRKLRVLAQNQQLLRLDWEAVGPIASGTREAAERAVAALGPKSAIVASDYGKGMISAELCARLAELSRARSTPLLVDPKSRDFRVYSGATLLTPNLRELEEACQRSLSELGDAELASVARRLARDAGIEAMVVTLGPRGMLVVPREGPTPLITATAREVFDVTGAGDAVIALLALSLAHGRTLSDAAALANVAAGIVVGKVGTAVVEPEELIGAISPHEASKLIERRDLARVIASLRAARKRVVFTNGCFDLLHAGHLHVLREAARFGDALIVGVNSDASTKRLKGPTRPLTGERERAELLAALSCVAGVVIFEEDTPLALIEEILPDVLVKGGDYPREAVVGREVVEARGGRLEIVPLRAGFSTTTIAEKIRAPGAPLEPRPASKA